MNKEFIFESEKELFCIIGNNIKYYRKLYSITKNEITQQELANKINVSTSLIGNLESKNTYQGISVYNLYKISKILERSYLDATLNYIEEFIYDVLSLYNKFYNDNNVLNEKDENKKNTYLALSKLVYQVIHNLLDVLAINEVEKM